MDIEKKSTIDKRAERRKVAQREREWHEHELEIRGDDLNFLYDPPAFNQIIQRSIDFLGGEPGDKILDMASGEGKETLMLAQNGYAVISLDISFSQLQKSRERVDRQNPNLDVMFVQANAEELPFKNGSLERLYGKAIIHHLDLDIAYEEVSRVLSDGGRMVFTEPMAHHPLFWIVRKLTARLRTEDERPLHYDEFVLFANKFGESEMVEAFLFAPLLAAVRKLPGGEKIYRRLIPAVHRFDQGLMRVLPFLKRLAWYDTVFAKN